METVRLNADVDAEAARRLRHVLLDERRTFTAWLRQQIDEYVEKKKPKGKKGRTKS